MTKAQKYRNDFIYLLLFLEMIKILLGTAYKA